MSAQTRTSIEANEPCEAFGEAGWDRAVFERQIAILGALAEAGLDVAQSIRDEATSDAAPGVDFGLAYTRVSKAVRMTLALQRRWVLDLSFEDRHGERPPAPATAHDRVRHGFATVDISDAQAVERLNQMLETIDRLEDYEDLADSLPTGPFNEIVARLCKDLGLEPDWLDRTEDALTSPVAPAMAGETQILDATSPARGRGGPRSVGEGMPSPPPSRCSVEAAARRYAPSTPFRGSPPPRAGEVASP